MAQGMTVYTASGAVSFSTEHRLGRILGRFSTGTSNGSYTYPSGYSGELFASAMGSAPGSPGVTVSGATITWRFGPASGITNVSVQVVYGCF